jgi:hypothetical protein
VEKIPVYSDEYIRKAEQQGSRFSNNLDGLNNFLNEVEPYYQCKNIIETPLVQKKHFTPSNFPAEKKSFTGNFTASSEYSGDNAAGVFAKIDSMLGRFATNAENEKEIFNAANFGTIAHACVEALLNGEEPKIPKNLSGFLTPADTDTLLEAGKELALRFIDSPLGIIAREAKERKNEFPFRSLLCDSEGNEMFINGSTYCLRMKLQCLWLISKQTARKTRNCTPRKWPVISMPQMNCGQNPIARTAASGCIICEPGTRQNYTDNNPCNCSPNATASSLVGAEVWINTPFRPKKSIIFRE